jgi:hypothetical protein
MNRSIARLLLAGVAACAVSLGAVSVADAATKYDHSFQDRGTLQLPKLRGVYGQVAQSCEITNNRLNIAGRFGFDDASSPAKWRVGQKLAIAAVSLRPAQPVLNAAADVVWRGQKIPTGQVVLDQDFDNQGGFAYVTRPVKKSQLAQLKLFRVLTNGHRDVVFGHRGYISVTIPGFDNPQIGRFKLIALPNGKVQILAQTSTTVVILRYTHSGRPDKTWGNSGVVELPGPSGQFITVDSATTTPEGGLLIGATSAPGKPSSGHVGVLKLDSRGKVASSWADGGFWVPPATDNSSGIYQDTGSTRLTAIRSGGGYAFLYSDTLKSGDQKYRLAYVDQTTGVTTLFNNDAGSIGTFGDGGAPGAEPRVLRETRNGTVFAHAETYYENPGGTLDGEVVRFSADADTPAFRTPINNSGFAAGALAVDPKANVLYACGGLGVTPVSKARPERSEQRQVVAVRRIKLG